MGRRVSQKALPPEPVDLSTYRATRALARGGGPRTSPRTSPRRRADASGVASASVPGLPVASHQLLLQRVLTPDGWVWVLAGAIPALPAHILAVHTGLEDLARDIEEGCYGDLVPLPDR